MANQFIFASGGYIGGWPSSSVERYDISRDVWEEMSQLNVARSYHSSCVLGRTVYVVCGLDQDDVMLNSIEKLETRDSQVRWQLIEMPPTSLLTPRINPVVAAISSSELLIMGGRNEADVLTFNTRDHSVKASVEEAPLICENSGVSSIVTLGVVVALVIGYKGAQKLIEYRNGAVQLLE